MHKRNSMHITNINWPNLSIFNWAFWASFGLEGSCTRVAWVSELVWESDSWDFGPFATFSIGNMTFGKMDRLGIWLSGLWFIPAAERRAGQPQHRTQPDNRRSAYRNQRYQRATDASTRNVRPGVVSHARYTNMSCTHTRSPSYRRQ